MFNGLCSTFWAVRKAFSADFLVTQSIDIVYIVLDGHLGSSVKINEALTTIALHLTSKHAGGGNKSSTSSVQYKISIVK
ncbi:hypothetical protein BDQ17DRAFT_146154 [Cyathus striatus]|nr:hypothetical protein BDQ17DRAFT_146154 [Cyathus striatus]